MNSQAEKSCAKSSSGESKASSENFHRQREENHQAAMERVATVFKNYQEKSTKSFKGL
jgi:hypothetical protein